MIGLWTMVSSRKIVSGGSTSLSVRHSSAVAIASPPAALSFAALLAAAIACRALPSQRARRASCLSAVSPRAFSASVSICRAQAGSPSR